MPYLGNGLTKFTTADDLTVNGDAEVTGTVNPSGDTASGDAAAVGFTSAEGLILTGQGSTNDVTIKNDADADVLEIPTGTTNVTVAGNLGVGGTVTGTGTSVFASLDISGDIDVDGTTNLDAVDIDGAVDINGVVHVSPNTAGKDTFELSTNSTDEGRLRIKNVDTTAVQIRAGGLSYFNGGNVAIGSTSASTVLDVEGAGVPLTINSNNSNQYKIQLLDAGSVRSYLGASSSAEFVVANSSASERMRIDSSGNLLVGGTEVNPQNQSSGSGSALRADGRGLFRATSSTVVAANLIGNDGEVIRISKDGSVVGSIGIQSSGFYIDGESGHEGIRFANGAITPRENGSDSDGASDLGATNNRFKDIYLSGGLYIDGTSANNRLAEYERGTWTPAVYKGSDTLSSPNSSHAYYIRLGDILQITFYYYKTGVTTTDSDRWKVSGVPFTMKSGSAGGYPIGPVGYINIGGDRSGNGFHRWQANNGTIFSLYGTNATTNVSNQAVEFSGTFVGRLA